MFQRIVCSLSPIHQDCWWTFQRHYSSLVKLHSDQFLGILTAEIQRLWQVFERHKYELRFAGGVVRDLLLNKYPEDIDLATTATPSQMKQMLHKEGFRTFNSKGEKHGTVSVRVNEKVNFEVTTLRVYTPSDDGRVRVKFVQDWSLDAGGRDLTINSMFLGFDGTIYDYVNGIIDLENRRINFVGNPSQRIQEDYIRILRYFRFYGQISLKPNDHSAEVLTAIKENCHNLSKIAGERIWAELKKILSVNYPVENMETLMNLGVAADLGFPAKPNMEEFKKVWSQSDSFHPRLMTRISALLYSEEEVHVLDKRLKLSTEEFELALLITNYRDLLKTPQPLKHLQELILDTHAETGSGNIIRSLVCEICKYHGDDELLQKLESWEIPRFPISGLQLLEKGMKKGPELKKTLEELRNFWKRSDYTLKAEELFNLIKLNDRNNQN